MNTKIKEQKNIIYLGNDSYYKDTLKLSSINNKLQLIKIDNLENIKNTEGFLLILTLDDLYPYFKNIIDIYQPDVYEIDRNIRNIFKKIEYIIIISIEEFDYGHIPFSNIYIEYANKYFNTNKGLTILVDKLYNEYIQKKELQISRIKKNNIEKLKKYLDTNENNFITTKEILKELNVNEKWLQRYMKDMNNLYNNIGYNKRKRLWYKVKNNKNL